MSTLPVNSTPSSSSNFQEIFCIAVKAYEKRTKKDLLAHPLACQLQACDSPTSILAVLQGQVNDLNQVRESDERLTKWLGPTVNVLLTFSATIGGGVSLVSITFSHWEYNVTVTNKGFFARNSDIRWAPPGQYRIHASSRTKLDIEA